MKYSLRVVASALYFVLVGLFVYFALGRFFLRRENRR